jgi:hypothetical protein
MAEQIAEKYGCSIERAQYYLDLKEEGYSTYQAKLMAGLIDPDY